MRLLLLPISTRRTLIYCEPLSQTVPDAQKTYVEKAVQKANERWALWEKAEPGWPNGWKLRLTHYGNLMFRRIPFEEWGLKSIPPLKIQPRLSEGEGTVAQKNIEQSRKVDVRYPGLYQALAREKVPDLLRRLSTERQALHKKRMIGSVVGMPFTIPVGLLPVLPNIPFFYLLFRAWSHWRALSGSRHLEQLVKEDLINPTPSTTMDSLYTAGLLHDTREDSRKIEPPTPAQSGDVVQLVERQLQSSEHKEGHAEELMLLRAWNGKLIAEKLGLPGLEIEIERAVEQVERDLKKAREQPTSQEVAGEKPEKHS